MDDGMTPQSMWEFYGSYHTGNYAGIMYGLMRDYDCMMALKNGYEVVKLKQTKYCHIDHEKKPYDYFYTKLGEPHDLAHVISPDARVPNYWAKGIREGKYPAEILGINYEKDLDELPVPVTNQISGRNSNQPT